MNMGSTYTFSYDLHAYDVYEDGADAGEDVDEDVDEHV